MNFSEIIRKYVILLKEKINTDEFIFLKKHHINEYEQKLIEFVPKFVNAYPLLFKKIIMDDDLEILNIFLNNLTDVDNGTHSLDEVRNNLGNILHDKFIVN